MAVQFILGRAGAGKTHHCLEAIRSRLATDAVEGGRLVLIVPEQASLQMERAVLGLSPGGATHRAHVLSFQRLAHRVLEEGGGTHLIALSETARAMVLRRLAGQLRDRLRYYRRVERLAGFLDRLEATLEEFIQEDISPAEMQAAAGGSDDSDAARDEALADETSPGETLFDLVADADRAPADREIETPAAGGLATTPGLDSGAAKLHDLHLLYRAYLDYLGTDRVDSHQFLTLAWQALDRCTWLPEAEIWVDGFASFTQQEALMLATLARGCRSMHVTVMTDPALGAEASASTAKEDEPLDSRTAALFARTTRTFRELHRLFVRQGVEVEDAVRLTARGAAGRFAPGSALAQLEAGFFTRAAETQESAARNSATQEVEPLERSNPAATVEVVELPTRRLEVEYAVARLMEWVQPGGAGRRPNGEAYRYRDVAFIARDLDAYADLVTQALEARRVPYFLDRRREVGHHPLLELIRVLPALVLEQLSTDVVRRVLKTALMPIDDIVADELENYLIAHGVAGWDAWLGDDWIWIPPALAGRTRRARRGAEEADEGDEVDQTGASDAAGMNPVDAELDRRLDRLNETRRRLLRVWRPWIQAARSGVEHVGTEWADVLVKMLEQLGVRERLAQWIAEAEGDGELDRAQEHRQVWRGVHAFLDDLRFAFADDPLSLSDLTAVVESGLSRFDLGLAPPMLDQVLIGEIERSRHPELKAVVLLGFNDGAYPKPASEDSILNDDDRAWLREAGLPVRPPVRDVAFDEMALAYTAVTRPREALVISYALADGRGQLLRPSPYLAQIRAACPSIVERREDDPARTRAAWDVHTTADLGRRLAAEFRRRPELAADEPAARARWNELYDLSRREGGWPAEMERSLAGLLPEAPVHVAEDRLARLLDSPPRFSVSQLETYAACPFRFFANYPLRLRERVRAVLEPTDAGRIRHALLEEALRAVADQDLADLSDEALDSLVEEACHSVALKQLSFSDGMAAGPRDAYRLRGSAEALRTTLRWIRAVTAAGTLRPWRMELSFGQEREGAWPPLVLRTPAGRTLHLQGVIDRIDITGEGAEPSGMVIDYKTRAGMRLDWSHVHHGLSLQLPTYLLVLEEVGDPEGSRRLRPIGGFFLGTERTYKTVKGPEDAITYAEGQGSESKLRGLLNLAHLADLDANLESGQSEYFSVYLKKDGTLGRADLSDALEEAEFRAVLDHVRRTLGSLGDALLGGGVDVRPYRLPGGSTPCGWCVYKSCCRFEWGIHEPRFLESWKRNELLDLWREGAGG
jgi:ATP-dependent helicase/nuclease subunit B